MRKVILQEWITLDGFAAGPKGEIDFFSNPQLNQFSDEDVLRDLEDIDTILLGATTYRLFADYWPTEQSANEVIAERLNATSKVVFSRSLAEAPWGKWEPARLVRTDPVAEVARLKQQEGKHMVLWGSLTLAHALIQAGLVDEYHLRICPSALGQGKPLFPGPVSLQWVDTKSYPSGMVLVRYLPVQ